MLLYLSAASDLELLFTLGLFLGWEHCCPSLQCIGIFPKGFWVELGLWPWCDATFSIIKQPHFWGIWKVFLPDMPVDLKINFIFPSPPPFLKPPFLYIFLRGHYLIIIDLEMKRESKLGSMVHLSLSLAHFAECKPVPSRPSSTYLSP